MMSAETVVAAARIALLVERELAADAVEIWTLYWHARRILKDQPREHQRLAAEAAMWALIREGVRAGEVDDGTGEFRFLESNDRRWRTGGANRCVGTRTQYGRCGPACEGRPPMTVTA